MIDSNVHLWDQRENPVFWLSDRTMLRDMLGNYDSLPDTFTLADYVEISSAYDAIFDSYSDDDRGLLFGGAARRVYEVRK